MFFLISVDILLKSLILCCSSLCGWWNHLTLVVLRDRWKFNAPKNMLLQILQQRLLAILYPEFTLSGSDHAHPSGYSFLIEEARSRSRQVNLCLDHLPQHLQLHYHYMWSPLLHLTKPIYIVPLLPFPVWNGSHRQVSSCYNENLTSPQSSLPSWKPYTLSSPLS